MCICESSIVQVFVALEVYIMITCQHICYRFFTEIVIERRSTMVDLVAPAPHKLDITNTVIPYPQRPGFFPRLHTSLLKASATAKAVDTRYINSDRVWLVVDVCPFSGMYQWNT